MVKKRKKKQASGYLKRFRDENTSTTEDKASVALDRALFNILPDEAKETLNTKMVTSLIYRVKTLRVEFPKSYKMMVDYLANGKPIEKLTPVPETIIRYILTTLPEFDPIAAMIKELEGAKRTCSTKKKKRPSRK